MTPTDALPPPKHHINTKKAEEKHIGHVPISKMRAPGHGFYFDNNATTPIDASVRDAMLPMMEGIFGNPSSSHGYGVEARNVLESARANVAQLLNAENASCVSFTSGSTESLNAIIRGVSVSRREAVEDIVGNGHIITTAIEHDATLRCCEWLERDCGFDLTVLPVDGDGRVRPEVLESALTSKTVLVTIMLANNEVGSVNDIRALVEVVRRVNPNAIFHTDASQAVGKIPVNVESLGVHFLTMTAHKMYGPKGVGATYARSDAPSVPPFILGPTGVSQRAGTANMVLIAGLGAAANLAHSDIVEHTEAMEKLRSHFLKRLKAGYAGRIVVNGPADPSQRLPNTANLVRRCCCVCVCVCVCGMRGYV